MLLQIMEQTLANIINQSQELTITLNSQPHTTQQWLQQKNLGITAKAFKNSLHLRSIGYGFQVQFENDTLNTFFAYFRTQKTGCYQFPLKFGINKGWTIKGAVMYLGEPQKKSNRAVEIIYPHLGLGMVFSGVWSDENSLINYVYLYVPEKIRVCGGCSKQFEESIDQDGRLFNSQLKIHMCKCELVSYCSTKCEKKHYGQHLIFCEIGQL